MSEAYLPHRRNWSNQTDVWIFYQNSFWSCSSALRKILHKCGNLQSALFSSHLPATKSWTQLTVAWITKARTAFWFSSGIPKPFHFKTRKNLTVQRLLLITWNWHWQKQTQFSLSSVLQNTRLRNEALAVFFLIFSELWFNNSPFRVAVVTQACAATARIEKLFALRQ